MASPAKNAAPADAGAKSKKGGGMMLPLIAVLFATGAGAGTSWYVTQQALAKMSSTTGTDVTATARPEVPKTPANYIGLDPAFVVNLSDERTQRFLQLQIEVMTRDAKAVEQIKHHAPRIRSQLLLLLGQQHPDDLNSREGKEQLQNVVLEEIRKILLEETGNASVDAVYFTSFVMQ